MAKILDSKKNKIAKRVIEIFEFFDADHPKATVMDIVRRYDRPQSSTSELLSSLAEIGLLYRDAQSRSYSPTPRLAAFGTAAQPAPIRDGRLFAFMDRIAQSTRYSVGLFGIVGVYAQLFRWSPGSGSAARKTIRCGASEPLSSSAAGLLLLSTMTQDASRRALWRLNAEAAEDAKFNPAELNERVALYRRQRHALGEAGFLPGHRMTAVLLPDTAEAHRPLALGVIYPDNAAVYPEALLAMLRKGVSEERGEPHPVIAPPAPQLVMA